MTKALFKDHYDVYELYYEAESWKKPTFWAEGISDRWASSWYAARGTAHAILSEARKLNLSDEDYERLRAVAARVATD